MLHLQCKIKLTTWDISLRASDTKQLYTVNTEIMFQVYHCLEALAVHIMVWNAKDKPMVWKSLIAPVMPQFPLS